jgi:predicted nucleotidyltransferase component of viral defense system
MIDERFIADWASMHPWKFNEYVEQDLVICRAVIAIFSDSFLSERLVWKGGTALHKLFLPPQVRYSEDIDLVQLVPGPIKPVFEHLQEALAWLPNQSTEQRRFGNRVKFRYLSEVEPQVPMRLKVEINCVEHYTELGTDLVPFVMDNGWFSGKCLVPVFKLPEMLGTKFNALYGRKKIRDLFDLDYALRMAAIDVDALLRCWRAYREHAGEPRVSCSEIIANMEAKLRDRDYLADMENFLAPGVSFNPQAAWANVRTAIVDHIPSLSAKG